MKLVIALSTAAFVLAPAVCLAEYPSSRGSASDEVNKGPANEGVTAEIGGNKCYADWAAVAKTGGSTSRDCPSRSSAYPDRNAIKKTEPHSWSVRTGRRATAVPPSHVAGRASPNEKLAVA